MFAVSEESYESAELCVAAAYTLGLNALRQAEKAQLAA
jgi:hypothetical protein